MYDNFMQEYLELGHMAKVSNADAPRKSPVFYMPHHGVLKPSSTTTALRVVYNGSCKTSTGIALNDVLMIGPATQLDLFDVLTRFRTHIFAFKADITKMYRQVQIAERQRSLQRILWRFKRSEPIETYELSTVTYGTASASFLATRTLKQVALDESQDFPEAAEKVKNDFYVDDLLTGASTVAQAIRLRKDITTLLARGCFPLHKWSTNNHDILSDVKDSEKEQSSVVNLLGLTWHIMEDKLGVSDNSLRLHNYQTKRSLLSTISSIFDPLGICAPVTFAAKIFMQALWSEPDISWDDSLPPRLLDKWNELFNQFYLISKFEIPRCIIPVAPSDVVKLQLHGFGDASEKGYGCVIYVRTSDSSGNHFVNLVGAKSKVAPKRKMTIPRLELCASLLLAQFVNKVTSCLNKGFNRIFLWTDSEITLYRIKSSSSKYMTFVGNRIAQIQELSSPDDWYHVGSSDNPADLVSRGCLPSQLLAANLWWDGPKFLSESEQFYPRQCHNNVIEDITELKRQEIVASAVQSEPNFIEKFSDLGRLVRCVAIWLRYFKNLRLPKAERLTSIITAKDYYQALLRLVFIVQSQIFPNELRSLMSTKTVSRKSKILQLNPFLDSANIIRVGGRLHNAKQLPIDQRFPMLLSEEHHFSHLLARHEHIRGFHCGPKALLYQLRQRFWITSGINLCKRIYRQCISCFRTKPTTAEQLMGDLPSHRVQSIRAFVNVGVDFCGPFLVMSKLRGRQPTKVYLAIFVCLSTKSVHIELVEDLTTEAFLAALRCFISRRGLPAHIYCDNATNFQGARNELRSILGSIKPVHNDNKILRFCTESLIEWHMIPPRSPHHGGIWEAAVRMAKTHIKRTIGVTTLTATELRTLAVQVETCLNSRPLTEDFTPALDLTALTPGHFLVFGPLTALPDSNLLETKLNRLSRWQHVQYLVQSFWKRWSAEYLTSLQQRTKWKTVKGNVMVGTLVLLKEDNLPPQKWLLGRITRVNPGEDGLVRVVEVKTATGKFKRSIAKICPLPISDNLELSRDGVGTRFQGGRHVTAFSVSESETTITQQQQ